MATPVLDKVEADSAASPYITVTFRIRRFNPEVSAEATWEDFQLENDPTRERLQSAEDRERFDDTTKCILCAACTTSCPVFWNDGQYFGPAAIVNAHRFIFDSRDEAAERRLEILNDRDGVWRCRTTFNCTDACPRGIEVTKAIQEVKRALITRRY